MEEIKKNIGEIAISPEITESLKKQVKNVSALGKTVEENLGKKTTELVEIILSGSFFLNSSDIHIEPEKSNAKLRLRIDGALNDVLVLDLKSYLGILSRIKLLSGLKLNVTNRPQDGRFSILIDNTEIEIRTSSIPDQYGESLVLRILNPKGIVSMEDLGLRPDLLKLFESEIKKPNGMIVCTGPTGSGKTTTLYAFLKKIATPDAKIITIEDPIEYRLEGISQSQVDEKKGYTFANGLRAIVRQDPDVILVGEIRDLVTAQIAIQAALTGHLVLSTLHTNDAAGTIARFVALGEKETNVAPAVNMAIAQRLVRKVCPKCKESKKISKEDFEMVKNSLKGINKEIKIPALKPDMKVNYPKGCDFCNNTGYKGRVGIFEAFLIDPDMEKFILTMPSISELKDKAIDKGMVSMKQDGFIKALEGTTTIEEVERITGEEEAIS